MICSLCWTKPEMSKLIEAHTIEDKPVVICHECVEIFQDILRDAGVSTEGKYLQGYRRDGEQLAAQWEDQAEGLTRNSNEGQVAGGLLYRECAKQLRAILPREPSSSVHRQEDMGQNSFEHFFLLPSAHQMGEIRPRGGGVGTGGLEQDREAQSDSG